MLIASNLELFKYEWIWQKSKGTNFLHAKNMPIKLHENICVFSKAPVGHLSLLSEKRMQYNPQGLVKVDKHWSRPQKYASDHKIDRKSLKLERTIEFENFPRSIVQFGNSDNRERGLHPTQKPVALFEYLVKTYTQEGETVLDNCIGSGTTAVACINTERHFIGIEKDPKFHGLAVERISQTTN